jgi:hypothetical protein
MGRVKNRTKIDPARSIGVIRPMSGKETAGSDGSTLLVVVLGVPPSPCLRAKYLYSVTCMALMLAKIV